MISKLFAQLIKHKIATGMILLVVAGGGYWGYSKIFSNDGAIRYATAQAQNGTLIVSISGSGQVSASNQVDIKPKVSGDVVYVGVKNGQEVKAGTLLVQIDSRKAQKAVNDAETSLETAKLELEKLLQPADAYSVMQAENALIQAKDNLTKLKFTQESNYQNALDAKQKAEDNLEKAYEDAFNTVANAFLDLPTLITGLRDILYSYELGDRYSWNITVLINSVNYGDDRYELEKFINSAETTYKTARAKYDKNFENYKNSSRYSDKEIIEALLNETLETTKAMAEAVKNENNMLDYWVDYHSGKNFSAYNSVYSKVTEYQSDLKTYTSKTNSHLSSLLSIQRNIQDNKETKLKAERDLIEMEQNQPLDLAAAERSVKDKEENLTKLKADPDGLDIRAKKIAIQQKEDALFDAQQNLADHYVRAPFDGIIANMNVKKGESVSSSAVATLITKQKIAEVSLNEIDIAQIKIGKKATLIFDAVPDLTITGQVVEIDAVGTASQGVVTYNVKIAFDTQDERIKPSMSVSAAIVTEAKADVLLVPNSAVKSQGGMSYVEIPADEERDATLAASVAGIVLNGALRRQPVQVGISNDQFTEIIDGLSEGDPVVTRAIQPSTAQTGTQSSQGGIPGLPGGSGAVRMPGGGGGQPVIFTR